MPAARPRRPRIQSRIVTNPGAGDPAAVERAIAEQGEAINRLAGEQLVPQRGTAGDLYYRAENGDIMRLPIGTAGQVLTVVDGLPRWS